MKKREFFIIINANWNFNVKISTTLIVKDAKEIFVNKSSQLNKMILEDLSHSAKELNKFRSLSLEDHQGK